MTKQTSFNPKESKDNNIMPKQNKKKLMVVPVNKIGPLKEFYKNRTNLKIVAWGDALLGHRFDEIFLSYPVGLYQLPLSIQFNIDDYKFRLKTKLKKDGVIIELN